MSSTEKGKHRSPKGDCFYTSLGTWEYMWMHTVDPPYPWILHLRIQPTNDSKYSEKIPESLKKKHEFAVLWQLFT